jgi:hypothetical protein
VTASLITFATTAGSATGANITFASLAGQVGTEKIVLNAGTGGAISVSGTTSNLNTLELVNAGHATFTGPVTLATLTVDSNGNANEAVALLGDGTDIVSAVTFNNLGGTTLNAGAGGTETFEGGLTSAAGPTTLGGTIETNSLGQSFGAVVLAANTVLSRGNDDVILGSSVTGAHALTVNSGGVTHIDGAVTIASLTTDAAGSTSLAVDNALISTTGAQTYNDAIILAADTTLSSGTGVTFASTLNGAQSLIIGADATFDGAVGNVTALTSFEVLGTTALNGGSVNTTGEQGYSLGVTLGTDTTLTATLVTFANGLDGAHALTVSGDASFRGAVGSNAALTSLVVTGTTTMSGGSVATTGTQTYGAVNLGGDTALTTVDALITLGQVTGIGDTLTISTGSGGITFGGLTLGAIDLTGTTGTETLASGTYDISAGNVFGNVSMGGTVTFKEMASFSGAVTLTADTVLDDGSNSATFSGAVDGAHALTVSGDASFGGVVGGQTTLTSLGVTGATALNGGTTSRPTARLHRRGRARQRRYAERDAGELWQHRGWRACADGVRQR